MSNSRSPTFVVNLAISRNLSRFLNCSDTASELGTMFWSQMALYIMIAAGNAAWHLQKPAPQALRKTSVPQVSTRTRNPKESKGTSGPWDQEPTRNPRVQRHWLRLERPWVTARRRCRHDVAARARNDQATYLWKRTNIENCIFVSFVSNHAKMFLLICVVCVFCLFYVEKRFHAFQMVPWKCSVSVAVRMKFTRCLFSVHELELVLQF